MFWSAWGCCARCRRMVSVRAPTEARAPGSRPYRHKPRRGRDEPWCDGHRYPALHYTESCDQASVAAVERIKREVVRRRHRRGRV